MGTKSNPRFGFCSAFIRGIGRIVDPFGRLSERGLYDPSTDPALVDYLALRSDWEAVGRDMASIIPMPAQKEK